MHSFPSLYTPALCVLILIAGCGGQGSSGSSGSSHTPQVSCVEAVHSSGQTFLVWLENHPASDATYRIYRSTSPIEDVHTAQLLYEVPEGSATFYADRVYDNSATSAWPARFLERVVFPQLDPACSPSGGQTVKKEIVPADHGAFVWTPTAAQLGGSSGPSIIYYAVTLVTAAGVENTSVTDANRCSVVEHVEDPLPLEVTSLVDPQPTTYTTPTGTADFPTIHVYVQYMDLNVWNPTFDAPNALNCWWGETDRASNRVHKAIQYAYTYTISEPLGGMQSGTNYPVVLRLHPKTALRMQKTWNYPELVTTDDRQIQVTPIDAMDTWWFGFAGSYDYRNVAAGEGGIGCAPQYPAITYLDPLPNEWPMNGKVVDYTEARTLRMLFDLQRDPVFQMHVAENRTYVVGHSMGGSGAVSFSMHYPKAFAAGSASKPILDYRSYVGGATDWPDNGQHPECKPECGDEYWSQMVARWGHPSMPLTLGLIGPSPWADDLIAKYNGAIDVWSWLDHGTQMASHPEDERAPFGISCGQCDFTIPFCSQGENVLGKFVGAGQAWSGVATPDHHESELYLGLSDGLSDAGAATPFYGYEVIRDESVPGFAQACASCVPPAQCSGVLQPDCAFPVVCDQAPPPNDCTGQAGSAVPLLTRLTWGSSWNANVALPVPPCITPHVLAPVQESATSWKIELASKSGTIIADVTPRRLQQFDALQGPFHADVIVDISDPASVPVSPPLTVTVTDGVITIHNVEISPCGTSIDLHP
jgi:hypothetical protein